MAINFGQQISAGLESTYDRIGRSQQQAAQLNQRLREFQLEKQTQQLVNRVKQKQLEMAQEAQVNDLVQQAIENRLDEEAQQLAKDRLALDQSREERLSESQEVTNRYRNAQIDQMQEDDGEGGGGQSRYPEIQRLNNAISDYEERKMDLQDEQEQAYQIGDFQTLSKTSNRIQQLNKRIQEAEGQLDGIYGGGSRGDSEQAQSTASKETEDDGTVEISSREEFNELPEGKQFIYQGSEYIKQNGQLVPQ